ncbi:vesicle-associated protein 1-2-like [Argentina anserina]|uniref:vesicle-associated protein 1-2-like n=1 Tax=Argentina anserina TaxID=57926 RepID=UPI0021766F80|nr:vesicle-associated protein 1-2-like [Potentilla anserina]
MVAKVMQSGAIVVGSTVSPPTYTEVLQRSNAPVETPQLVNHVDPPRPPSPIWESLKEGSLPMVSVGNVNSNDNEFKLASRAFRERQEPRDNHEAKSLIASLTEQKNYTIQQNNKL